MEDKAKAEADKAKRTTLAVPKYYARVCEEQPAEYSDYTKNFMVQYSSVDKYEIVRKVGRGKYSEVYQGIRNEDDHKVIIKILKPGSSCLAPKV